MKTNFAPLVEWGMCSSPAVGPGLTAQSKQIVWSARACACDGGVERNMVASYVVGGYQHKAR
jgi:hypothetical protein